MLKSFFLFTFLLCLPWSWVHAIDGAQVLEVSSSGKSIMLNRGSFEGLKEGMKGRLLLPVGQIEKPEFQYVAYGEVIKAHDGYSYWYLKDINNKITIEKGLKLVFVTMERVNKGRKKLDIEHQKVILRKGQTPLKYVREKGLTVPKEVITKGKNYEMGDQLTETYSSRDADKEIYEFDIWAYDKGVNYVYEYMQEMQVVRPSSTENKKDISKYQEKYDEDLFNSVVDGSVRKFNDFEYNLDTFYKETKKDEDFRQVRDQIVVQNVYKQYQDDKKERNWVSPQALGRIKRDGKLWSVDMTDQQLRRFFVNSGIRQENERQRMGLTTYEQNELQFFYSTGLLNHFDVEQDGFQGTNYSLGVAYEFYLRRTAPSLARWSLDASFERTIAFYDVGTVNGRFTEGILKVGVNYYIYNLPSSIYRWTWALGTGLKRGNSVMQSVSLSKEYDYQVFGIPFYVMAKYRFVSGDERDQTATIGWGINLKLSNEFMSMSTVNRLDDDIFEGFTVNDIRFTVGLSAYF